MFEKYFIFNVERISYYDSEILYNVLYMNFCAEYCCKHNLKVRTFDNGKYDIYDCNGTFYNVKKNRFKKVKFDISTSNFVYNFVTCSRIKIMFKTKKQLDEFTKLYLKYKLKS